MSRAKARPFVVGVLAVLVGTLGSSADEAGANGTASTSASAGPVIVGFAPTAAFPGTAVTIVGRHLGGATVVTFNGEAASGVTVRSDSFVVARVPGAASSGPISITTPSGTATSSSRFEVLFRPTIASFTPIDAARGATVTINGSHLAGTTAVRFNGIVAAQLDVVSDSTVTAQVPPSATTGRILVTTPTGTAVSGGTFTVIQPPAIGSFSPRAGPPGTRVTIAGAHLTGTDEVTFNGTVARGTTVISDSEIATTVPADATTGPIVVTTPGGTATSSMNFSIPPPPSVASFSPTFGPVGTAVTISGANFAGTTGVAFGGIAATSFAVVSDSEITATVPRGAVAGPVTVTNASGAASSSDSFTVTVPVSMTVTGGDQVVFDWTTDRCDEIDYPDIPARAFRDASGNVQLLASHYENRRMIGPDLDHLTHPCAQILASHYNTDPSAFEDFEWIASPYTTDGTHVYALVHDEFDAWAYPGLCSVPWPDAFYKCWYNAITLTVSSDGGASYQDANPPLVAGVPYPYVDGNGMDGIFTPSNIVRNPADGYYYSIGYINERNSYIGKCLFRTNDLADPASWRAWSGGDSFDMTFVDPYGPNPDPSAHLCKPLPSGFPADLQPNSLTYSTVAHEWMLVGMAAAGVYFTLSPDLIHWSTPQLFYQRLIVWSYQCGDSDPIAYPSLIDPSSTSMNFTTTGTTAYLYFTVFHYVNCQQTSDRDLVRVPVTISPLPASARLR